MRHRVKKSKSTGNTKMSAQAYNNRGPKVDIPPDAPKEAIKIEFARRLQQRMTAKDMRQADLARAIRQQLPKNTKFNRDTISVYIRGKSLPNPVYLEAIARALSCTPEELMPSRGLPSAADVAPSFDMRETSDGNVWLRVNQGVSWEVATKIMQMLKSGK